MLEQIEMVREFLLKMGKHVPSFPGESVPTSKDRILWGKLILEEALEMLSAAGLDIKVDGRDLDVRNIQVSDSGKVDIVKFADGAADVNYVNLGFCLLFGIRPTELFEEVCKNNLDKFGEGHSFNEDGKLIKPPNHRPPDVRKILESQGYEG